ncbi:MAG: YdcF family protein [Limisphaerales bacterium]
MKRKIFRIAIAAFLLLLLLVVFSFFFPQEILTMDSGPVKADVIIVLGGGFGTHERPQRAAQIFKQHCAPRVIVSGAGDDEVNRRLLIRNGVPATDIEVESKSQTTRENAKFTIKLLRAEKIHSAIIVTSWYHSRRALKTFEHFASEIKFYSRPSYFEFKRSDWRHDFPRQVYLEYVKLPGYWICYGICPF